MISKKMKEKKQLPDADIINLLKKMVKQRKDSYDAYKKGGREELAQVEEKEINIINNFLPKQLNEDETKKICEETIKSLGAQSIKDMGKVMGQLKKSGSSDSLDFSLVSKIIKEILK